MRVIGTAGHVDHGKSTLVKRLTGIDPDRLAEEKARALTIDLGFAWLTLPDGETLGIVDVPGHHDFIENMLAGVGGIDAVMLVVAADEGVMPQTREHLAILDLLGIDAGLVALTRVDLVEDPEWLELVKEEVLELLEGTSLADAPMLPVSATEGVGIDELLESLSEILARSPERLDGDQPRLPVDRVFSMSGFGTVVTGTLTGGSLCTGDEIELQPGDMRGRIRGLQSYQKKVQRALPGSRVAVNISGLAKSAVARGHVLGRPGQLQSTMLADVKFRYLSTVLQPLRHNAEVKLFTGTAETSARVRLLVGDELVPGASGWLQLRLARPLPLAHNDRFILRRPSPAETIGGGVVIDPQPGRNWKRNQPKVLRRLQVLADGSPAERLALAADGRNPLTRRELQREGGMGSEALESALAAALQQKLMVTLDGPRWLALSAWSALERQLHAILAEFQMQYPLRRGMPREALRSQLRIDQATLSALIERDNEVAGSGDIVHLRKHVVSFSPEQRILVDRLTEMLRANPFMPPSWTEAVAVTGEELLGALLEKGDLVRVAPDILFAEDSWRELVWAVLEIIKRDGSVSASQLRDRFETSRKYAIGLLESLDDARITRREGDVRVRGAAPVPPELRREESETSHQHLHSRE